MLHIQPSIIHVSLAAMGDPRRALLGLDAEATMEQVRAAYLGMVKHVHPDSGGTAAAFSELDAAYRSLLRSPEPPASPFAPSPSPLSGRAFRPTRGGTLAFCGLSLLAGVGVFAGALTLHRNTDMYGARRYKPKQHGVDAAGVGDLRAAVLGSRRRDTDATAGGWDAARSGDAGGGAAASGEEGGGGGGRARGGGGGGAQPLARPRAGGQSPL